MMKYCKYLSIFLSTFILLFISAPVFSAEKLAPLTILLDWFPNPDHAPLFVAQEQGYFKQEGLDVHIIGPANPSDSVKLVAAGKADIGITYQPQLLVDQARGLPLVQLGTLINVPLSCVAVSTKSNIVSLKDLNHKTVGYSSSGTDQLILNAMLNSVHLDTRHIKLINVNYNLIQALMTHQVDGITGIMRNVEIVQLQLKKFPVRVFYPELYGVPSYSELIYVVNKKKRNDPRFKQFLTAVTKGENYLQQHPDSSFTLFAKNHPELNNTLNQQIWATTLPYFAKDPSEINHEQETKLKQFLDKQGLLKHYGLPF